MEEARIKIKGDSSPFCSLPPTKLNDIFVRMDDLNKEIHTNKMNAFAHTSQCGNHYIMVAVHLDANYIFAKPMKNRTEGEMIRVYQKIKLDESGRVGTKKAGTQQQMLGGNEGMHQRKRHGLRTYPPWDR